MRIFFCLYFLFFTTAIYGADLMIGGVTQYTVRKGDRFETIGAKFGVFWKNIAKENGLDPYLQVPEGQQLKITTRKIVPMVKEDGIIINIADRTLYLFKKGKLTAYPVGLGLPLENEIGDWRTPLGKFSIVAKKRNPSWYVPDSIQMEMAAKGKTVEEIVPPGPKNPLGRFALQTTIPGILIHETIRPASVYRYQSHGCIRVLPDDMEKLFNEVERGTKGELIYVPVKIGITEDGKTFLEVRTDTYRKIPSVRDHVWKLIDERQLLNKVDPSKVEMVIKEKTGIAEDVTLYPKAPTEGRVSRDKTLYQRVFDFFKQDEKRDARKPTHSSVIPSLLQFDALS